MTLAKLANNSVAVWKDRRYKQQVAQLRAIPGIKRIGLGHLRQTSHHKPNGSLAIAGIQNGTVLVLAYSGEGLCELRCYADAEDLDAVVARIASLPNILPQAALEDDGGYAAAEPPADEPCEDETVPLAAPFVAAVAAAVDRAIQPFKERIAALERDLAALHDEHRAVLELAAALESQLNAAGADGRPGGARHDDGAPGEPAVHHLAEADAPPPAPRAKSRAHRQLLKDFLAEHGLPIPDARVMRLLGIRIRKAAEEAGYDYAAKEADGPVRRHPVTVMRRMLPDIRALCAEPPPPGRVKAADGDWPWRRADFGVKRA